MNEISATYLNSLSTKYNLKAFLTNKKDLNHIFILFKSLNILFSSPKTKIIVDFSKDEKLILLSSSITSIDDLMSVCEDNRDKFPPHLSINKKTLFDYPLTIGYGQMTQTQVLSKIMPRGTTLPSSFETVGHIAHFNLREELMPYKRLIGQVVLDKNEHIRTVVHKTESISSKFRTVSLELLAGEPDFVTVAVSFYFNTITNFIERTQQLLFIGLQQGILEFPFISRAFENCFDAEERRCAR